MRNYDKLRKRYKQVVTHFWSCSSDFVCALLWLTTTLFCCLRASSPFVCRICKLSSALGRGTNSAVVAPRHAALQAWLGSCMLRVLNVCKCKSKQRYVPRWFLRSCNSKGHVSCTNYLRKGQQHKNFPHFLWSQPKVANTILMTISTVIFFNKLKQQIYLTWRQQNHNAHTWKKSGQKGLVGRVHEPEGEQPFEHEHVLGIWGDSWLNHDSSHPAVLCQQKPLFCSTLMLQQNAGKPLMAQRRQLELHSLYLWGWIPLKNKDSSIFVLLYFLIYIHIYIWILM